MCEYCEVAMFLRSVTPEERMRMRIDKFVKELRKYPMQKWRNANIADTLDSFIACEEEFENRMIEVQKEIRETGVGLSG